MKGALGGAAALEVCRALSRKDATAKEWAEARPHTKPGLLVLEAKLQRDLRDEPDNDGVAVVLREVRRYLGREG